MILIFVYKSFKVMSTIASHSPLNISILGHRLGSNGVWGIEWSLDRWRHVTSKGQVVTSIRLKLNISKTAGDAI